MFISPVAITIFGWDIYWYALAYSFSLLFIYWRSTILLNSLNFTYINNITKKDIDIDNFLFFAGFGMIIGGKIGYLFYDFKISYIFNPYGFAFFGGFIGVITACLLFTQIYNLNFRGLLLYLDITLSYLPIGIGLVRITNFINQECIGLPVEDLFWSVQLSNEDFYRYPTQIYEAITEGLILFYILLFIRSYFNTIIKYPGIITVTFLKIYSIFRFIIEFYKDNVFSNEIYINQLGCGMVFLFGSILFLLIKYLK